MVTDSEMEQQIGDKEETEAIMDTEREIVEEDAQGDQPDLSLIHILTTGVDRGPVAR